MIDFVYPPLCAGCGKPGEVFCADCQSKVHLIKKPVCPVCGRPNRISDLCDSCRLELPPFQALRSWGEYSEPLREALHTLKYRSNLGLASHLSEKLLTIITENQWDLDLVVPVPLGKTHSKERGFNQSEKLARPLALGLGLPLVNEAVIRQKETSSQVKLTREERFRNLEGAFLGNSAKLKGKKVLLVDDVVTTGATMNSCTKALLDAGCTSVFCITVAQTAKKHHKTL